MIDCTLYVCFDGTQLVDGDVCVWCMVAILF